MSGVIRKLKTSAKGAVLRLRGGSFGPPVVMGEESLMKQKAHGSTEVGVQTKLKYAVDERKADEICCYNRHYAEHSGYFMLTDWIKTVDKTKPTEYYDSVSGRLLFTAPIGRTFDEFLAESKCHGWPSFRDAEVNWEYVRVLPDGETVSVDGTHLGHNIPDKKGNRYCINLVCVAGYPASAGYVRTPEKAAAASAVEGTFKLLKNASGCTGMFYRPDPRPGEPKKSGASNWPRDNALLKGKVHVIGGKKWLECTEVKQSSSVGLSSWEKVPNGNWMPFEYEQYYLKEVE